MVIDDSAVSTEIDGYTRETCATRTVYIREGCRDRVAALGFVAGHAVSAPIEQCGGRVLHDVHQLLDGTRVLWKTCRRGGLIEPILGDRHFDVRRFFAELRITAQAEARGIRVAPVLALAISPYKNRLHGNGATGISKRVEILTAMIDGAADVGDTLVRGTFSTDQRRRLTRAMATELRSFHGAGFHHGDLNLKNILWREREDGSIEVTLIDLDPGAGPAPAATPRHRNLLRLWRSYLKGERAGRWRVPVTDLYRFAHEYFRADRVAITGFWQRATRARALSRLRHGLRPKSDRTIGGPIES